MQPEPIAKTLEAVFKELSVSKKDALQDVYSAIWLLLDEKEKKHTRPWRLKGGVLTLHIDSPAWMHALNLKKARLLKQLQEKIGRDTVKDIRLRIGVLK